MWLTHVSYLVASDADPTDWLIDTMDEWHRYTINGAIFQGPDFKKLEDWQTELDAMRDRWAKLGDDNLELVAQNYSLKVENERLEWELSETFKNARTRIQELVDQINKLNEDANKHSKRACSECGVPGTNSKRICDCKGAKQWRKDRGITKDKQGKYEPPKVVSIRRTKAGGFGNES